MSAWLRFTLAALAALGLGFLSSWLIGGVMGVTLAAAFGLLASCPVAIHLNDIDH